MGLTRVRRIDDVEIPREDRVIGRTRATEVSLCHVAGTEEMGKVQERTLVKEGRRFP